MNGSLAADRSRVTHLEVGEAEQGRRLDKVLAGCLKGVPMSRIFRLVRRGEVRVNGKRATPELRLKSGDSVRLPPVRSGETVPKAPPRPREDLLESIRRCVIHEDERLLVLDKPAGIAVHGGSGLSFGVIEALRALRPRETLELVHRLDRDTSGLLLVARRPAALRTLHALLREGQVSKSYLVLLEGRWAQGHCRVEAALRTDARVHGERTVRVDREGKPAVTEFMPIQHYARRATLLEATLHTGRTHQIRVHAAHSGHPVAGDTKYGNAAFNEQMAAIGLRRMFLHAHTLSFTWPGGQEQSFSAPLPDVLRAVLDALPSGRAQGRA